MQRMTISDLARAEGVDVALVSRRVKNFKLEFVPGPRGAKFISVASYLKAIGRQPGDLLHPPGDLLEFMHARGKFGRGAEAAARMRSARLYRALRRGAAAGDPKADEAAREIDYMLGMKGADLCRLVLIEGRALAEFDVKDRAYLLQRLVGCLDEIARKYYAHKP